MRRITIEEKDGGWGFDADDGVIVAKTILLAAIKAMDYGESRRSQDVGYVIKFWVGGDLTTLHHRVF